MSQMGHVFMFVLSDLIELNNISNINNHNYNCNYNYTNVIVGI